MNLQQAEPDEPGSVQYNYQVWRQQRNEHINIETQSQADIAGWQRFQTRNKNMANILWVDERKWDKPVATIQVTGHPLTMAFHSYDKHLVVANETDMIR